MTRNVEIAASPAIVADGPEPGAARGTDRAVRAVACAATFVVCLDVAVTNQAFGAIRADLPGTQSTLTWVVSAYATAFAAWLAVGGRLSDVLGHRRLLLGGVAGFAVASAVCAVAPDVGWLIGARAGQGVAGALLLPAALGAMLIAAGPARAAAAVGAWSAAAALATAVGPFAGALLVDWWGWRSIFAANLPVCAVLVVLTVRALPADPRPGRWRELPDLAGTALLTAGIAAVVAAVTEGHQWGWASPITLALLGAGVAMVVLVAARSFGHRRPAVDVRLWRYPGVAAANAVNALLGLALFGYLLAVPLWMAGVWRLSLLASAGAVCVSGCAAILGAGLTGRHITPGTARWFACAGMALFAAGFAVLATPAFGAHRAWVLWAVVAAGIGVGLGAVVVALSVTVAAAVPSASAAAGMGLALTARQIGGALGVAVVAAVVADPLAPGFIASVHHLLAALAVVSAAAAVLAAVLLLGGPSPHPSPDTADVNRAAPQGK